MAPVAAADLADEVALAERHAPVVRLVEQPEECGPGEPYEPIDVDVLFDEPTVALRGPWNPTDLVEIAPKADDVVGLYNYHLDFPGRRPQPGVRLRALGASGDRGKRPDDLRPRCDRSRAPREARASVLVLLRLQRLEQPARGRLGERSSSSSTPGTPARHSDASPSRSATASTREPKAPTGMTTSSSSSTGAGRSSIPRPARTRTSSKTRCTSAARRSRESGATTRAAPTWSSTRLCAPSRARPLRHVPRSPGSRSRGAGESCRRRSSTGRPVRT